ncbi:uncharacterized protein [Cicer arietinum]|uniref:Uncharacterized protein LOC101513529 n=1 Tax=Cicer arietinum TaxID=3827 RepID=A0A1S2YNF5_CICAR|nr:uncharacterized protein LOC101513529 [Cicer arietinum]
MESLSFNLQAEKLNAILKNRKLQRITGLLRIIEVFIVLILISRISMKLPIAVRNSSEYLRDFSIFMNSPRFVFLIGNVIIITLFAQGFGKNVPKELEPENIYEMLVRKSIKHEEKDDSKVKEGDSVVEEKIMKRGVKKSYRRCESEILKKRRRVMRRCESENNGWKRIEGAPVVEEEMVRISYPEDEMSNEEFRRTVEAFIARQQRIRREEDDYSSSLI